MCFNTVTSGNGTHRRRSVSERGTASIEAIIVLPIFVLLFVGVLYFADLIQAKTDADTEARRCAWLYSMANCGEVPEGCARPDDAPPTASNPFQKALDTGIGKAQNGAQVAPVPRDNNEDVPDIFESIVKPILGKAINEVTNGNRVAHASRTVRRPPLFGGNTANPGGQYRLACNLTAQTERNIGAQVWHLLRP